MKNLIIAVSLLTVTNLAMAETGFRGELELPTGEVKLTNINEIADYVSYNHKGPKGTIGSCIYDSTIGSREMQAYLSVGYKLVSITINDTYRYDLGGLDPREQFYGSVEYKEPGVLGKKHIRHYTCQFRKEN